MAVSHSSYHIARKFGGLADQPASRKINIRQYQVTPIFCAREGDRELRSKLVGVVFALTRSNHIATDPSRFVFDLSLVQNNLSPMVGVQIL